MVQAARSSQRMMSSSTAATTAATTAASAGLGERGNSSQRRIVRTMSQDSAEKENREEEGPVEVHQKWRAASRAMATDLLFLEQCHVKLKSQCKLLGDDLQSLQADKEQLMSKTQALQLEVVRLHQQMVGREESSHNKQQAEAAEKQRQELFEAACLLFTCLALSKQQQESEGCVEAARLCMEDMSRELYIAQDEVRKARMEQAVEVASGEMGLRLLAGMAEISHEMQSEGRRREMAMERDLHEKGAEIRRLQDALASQSSEMGLLKCQLAALQQQQSSNFKLRVEEQQQQQLCRRRVEEAEDLVEGLKAEKAILLEELVDKQQRMDELEKEVRCQKQMVEFQVGDRSVLVKKLQEAGGREKEALRVQDEAMVQLERVEQQLEDERDNSMRLQREMQFLKLRCESLQSQSQQSSQELLDCKEQIAALEIEEETLRANLANAEDELEVLNGEIDSARGVLNLILESFDYHGTTIYGLAGMQEIGQQIQRTLQADSPLQ